MTRPHPRSRPFLLAAVLAILATTVGCGIPRDSEPREVTVDVDLLGPTSSTSSLPTGPAEVFVYFPIEKVRLERVARSAETDSNPEVALRILMAGPSLDEREDKLSTFIPNGTEVLATERDGDTLIVNLNEGIDNIQGANLTTAYAQMVFTATSVKGEPQVSKVQFRVNGEKRQAFSDDGQKSTVTTNDYEEPNIPR
jgi:spore germination protein GerM